MHFEDYISQAMRTAKSLPTLQDDFDHAVLGMITELGELATSVKRSEIYGKGYTDEIRANILEEAGDFMWYVALAARTCDSPISDHKTTEALDASSRLFTPKRLTFLLLREVQTISAAAPWSRPQLDEAVQFLAYLLRNQGLTLTDACAHNILKLRTRFPDAYSDEAAEARADKGGLTARQS